MIAGRVSFVGELDVASFPHTETLVVVEGELRLRAAGAAPLMLGPGMGAVIARGTALRIDAAVPVRFVFCAAAALSGIGGAMFTLQVGFMSPSFVGIVPSIEMVIFAAVGGRLEIGAARAGGCAVRVVVPDLVPLTGASAGGA